MSELKVRQSKEEVQEEHEVQVAPEGRGPLLQRDYMGIIEGSDWPPARIIELVRTDFPLFSPEALARFERLGDPSQPLREGEEMEVNIKGTGCHKVVAVRVEPQSLTLRTIQGHPEAGRITFGAHHDDQGRLVFRIRSRARINNLVRLVGYFLMGKAAQTHIWTTFIERVAEAIGGRIAGKVEVGTQEVEDSASDEGLLDTPTFPAAEGVPAAPAGNKQVGQ